MSSIQQNDKLSNQESDKLYDFSKIMIGDFETFKYDIIAEINIDNTRYFNVYRRYNNVYEIMIQDKNDDIYTYKDYTVRETLARLLCLNKQQAGEIGVEQAYSYKHGSEPPSMEKDLLDMRWSEIQGHYQGVYMELMGVFVNDSDSESESESESRPSTPENQIIDLTECPDTPVKREYTPNEMHAADALLTLRIPPAQEYVSGRKRSRNESTCYCNHHDDAEMSEEELYTVLRNGKRVTKH